MKSKILAPMRAALMLLSGTCSAASIDVFAKLDAASDIVPRTSSARDLT
ncbi:hypothetical protein ABIB73_005278 [Bradyrhizobium sp. F1.4.3]